ncbi:MAG: DUF4159 domain-containing protein [Phycisphaeraceae bacterium]
MIAGHQSTTRHQRSMFKISFFAVVLTAAALLCFTLSQAHAQSNDSAGDAADAGDNDSEIVVARLIYDSGKSAVCFADQFLATYARESGQNVRRTYAQIALDSDKLFEHPFVVLSGQEAFTLSAAEKKNLKRYIDRGGFVLASAGCSNVAWARSFETIMAKLFGDEPFEPIGTDHPLFHTVYDIDHLGVRKAAGRVPIQALTVDGRVRVLYSPLGLNDTGNAGGDCCCCGGSEITNARQINVNALGYALTR